MDSLLWIETNTTGDIIGATMGCAPGCYLSWFLSRHDYCVYGRYIELGARPLDGRVCFDQWDVVDHV